MLILLCVCLQTSAQLHLCVCLFCVCVHVWVTEYSIKVCWSKKKRKENPQFLQFYASFCQVSEKPFNSIQTVIATECKKEKVAGLFIASKFSPSSVQTAFIGLLHTRKDGILHFMQVDQ